MFRLYASDLAVDLGTANTLIYEKNNGIILNEPSVIALRVNGNKKIPVAFGAEAKAMLGRTPPGVEVIRPVRTGVIADFEGAAIMLSHYIDKVISGSFTLFKPRVIVGIPSGITEVEKRAIRLAIESKTRDVQLIEEAMAAAIGAGLPVNEATANMIVDIGGGTTDIAVISLGDIVKALSIRQGGDAMDEAIINYIRRHRHLLIGETTAEKIKITVGSALPDYDEIEMEIRGRSLTSGSPAAIIVTSKEIREAISEVITAVIAAIRQTLEITPPELAGDIISTGLTLAGGGSLLKGLAERLSAELKVNVRLASDPISAVVTGAGRYLEQKGQYQEYSAPDESNSGISAV
jgi:rod shape-determining protein MreB